MNNSSNVLIILLLVANLCATLYFGTRDNSAALNNQGSSASRHELPEIITKDVRKKIKNDFIKHFNARDYDALHLMFGEVARTQFTKEETVQSFEKLSDYFGKITYGTYASSEFAGSNGSVQYYVLYYRVVLSEEVSLVMPPTLRSRLESIIMNMKFMDYE